MMSFLNSYQKKLSVIAFFILFAFSVSIIYAQQASDKPATISMNAKEKSLPVYKIGSHIFTKVSLNGDEKYWVIDTGAGSTVIDSKYAKDKGLPEIGKSKAMGASGEVEITIYNIPKFSVNDTTIENIPVIGFDVYGLFKRKYNIEVAGILGFNFLSKYIVKVDYDNMMITLFEPAQFKYQGTGNKAKFQLSNNIILVPLMINNKYEGTFALDTGASSTIFNYPYALKNKITEMDGPDLKAFGAQGGFILKLIRFPEADFGGYALKNVVLGCPTEKPAGVLGTDAFSGTMGINILQNFVFYIDYPNETIYLEKGKKFDQEFPSDKSGLQLEVNKDKQYEIIHISKKSAAESAGLKVGDIVTAINGKSLVEMSSIDEINSVFKDKDGTKIELKIMRDVKELDIPLILKDPFKK